MHESMAEKNGANLGCAERQAKMARRTGVHGIDGEAAGLIGCFGEEMGLQGHLVGRKIELSWPQRVQANGFRGIKKANLERLAWMKTPHRPFERFSWRLPEQQRGLRRCGSRVP
jgi:hypothetical protein